MFDRRKFLRPSSAFLATLLALSCGALSSCNKEHANRRSVGSIADDADSLTNIASGMPVEDEVGFGIVSTAVTRPRIGDRFYIAAVLRNIFGPKAEDEIAPLVTAQVGTFGGACDPFGKTDGNHCYGAVNLSQTSLVPSSLSTREGYLIRACESIGIDDEAIAYAVETALGQPSGTFPNAKQVADAYDLFFPGKAPSKAVHSALVNVVSEARDNDFDPLDGWRFLLVTLCLAPSWQFL